MCELNVALSAGWWLIRFNSIHGWGAWRRPPLAAVATATGDHQRGRVQAVWVAADSEAIDMDDARGRI